MLTFIAKNNLLSNRTHNQKKQYKQQEEYHKVFHGLNGHETRNGNVILQKKIALSLFPPHKTTKKRGRR